MKLLGELGRFVNLRSVTDKAFGAAFFFLPISKPLLYLSLLAAFFLFTVSGDIAKALRNWRNLPWTIPALVLALLPLSWTLMHGNGNLQFSKLQLSYYWLFAFMTFFAASQIRVVPWMHAFLGGVFGVWCYTQLVAIGWWPFKHAPSASANHILYSYFLALAIVLSSVLYKHADSPSKRLAYLTGMVLFFFGLMTGNGRTGMLIVVILLPYILLNIFRKRNVAKVTLGCLVAVLMLMMSSTVQVRINQAVQDIALFRQDVTQTSLGYRFQMWETAWEVFRENPLLGAGPRGFQEAWADKASDEPVIPFREPHNAFLFYASSYGVIGLLSLIWLYVALLWTGWRQRHSLAGGIVFSFAAVVVLSSFTNTVFMGAVNLACVMLFIGLQGGLLYPSSGNGPCKERQSHG